MIHFQGMSAYNDDDDGKLTLSHVSVADVVDCLELFFPSSVHHKSRDTPSLSNTVFFPKCY